MKKLMFASALALALCGCVYKGGKITDGTELSIGLNVPATEGVGQLSLLNYVDGFRVGVANDSRMTVKRWENSYSSFLGCVTLANTNATQIAIEPCVVSEVDTNAVLAVDAASTNETEEVSK